MLQLTSQSIIYVASNYIDFRKGLDGLAAICRNQFLLDPLNGALFLFYNRSYTTIKILGYDGQGMWLCSKRLSQGRFKFRSSALFTSSSSSSPPSLPDGYRHLCHRALHVLINNGELDAVKFGKNWRKIKQPSS